MIFSRNKVLGSAERELRTFEDKFWSGMDLSRLYQKSPIKNLVRFGLYFCSGFKEFARLMKASDSSDTLMEGSSRAMRVALSRDIDSLERHYLSLQRLVQSALISDCLEPFGVL